MQDGRTGWRGHGGLSERTVTLFAVAVIHVLLGFVLLNGLAPRLSTHTDEPLSLIDLVPPPPPPPPQPLSPAKKPTRNAPAPAAPKADPKPLSAPPVRVPQPAKLTAAPVASQGSATQSGAALAGTGTGAAGTGSGTGLSGGGGIVSHARWITGAITDRDYPDQAKRAGVQGAVAIVFTVRRDGRIQDCRIDRSSGSAELDRLTCLLAERRLLFDPARDSEGRPVDEVSGRYFRFVLGRRAF